MCMCNLCVCLFVISGTTLWICLFSYKEVKTNKSIKYFNREIIKCLEPKLCPLRAYKIKIDPLPWLWQETCLLELNLLRSSVGGGYQNISG